MIKKILPISVFVLVLVLILLLGIQRMLSGSNSQGTSSLTPTMVQGRQGGNGYTTQTGGKKNPSSVANPTAAPGGLKQKLPISTPDFTLDYSDSIKKYVVSFKTDNGKVAYDQWVSQNQSFSSLLTEGQVVIARQPEELQQKLPIIAPDFTLDYSSRMQRYVVTLKTDKGQAAYDQWFNQNIPYVNELQNPIVTKQTIEELHAALDYAKKNELSPEKKAEQEAQSFTKDLNTIINLPFLFMQMPDLKTTSSTSYITPTPVPASPFASGPTPSSNPTSNTQYTYYSQCDGPYDALPLPNGCTICEAGCGPTSVAMILSSYIDKSLTPPITVDLLNKSGVRIGCYGSYVYELYSYLKKRGDLQVTDFIIPAEGKLSAQEVAKDFRGYIKGGYTILVAANFKTDGGGHFFWVTDVNENGDILAYDPYYGKQQTAPINENRYTPAPYYRYAFAIKKS